MFNEQQFILNNEYIQFLEDGKVVYDTRWSYEDFLNGGPNKMEKEQIIKEIEETIRYNKTARCGGYIIELYKDATRRSNDVLAKARHYIKNNDEYTRGLNDAWEAFKKLEYTQKLGGLGINKICEIFDVYATYEVFDKFSAKEVVEKIKAYEKEQEAAKPKLGDVVEVRYCDRIGTKMYARGVFIKESDTTYNVIVLEGDVYVFDKDHIESIEKTGEHVDILGALGKE